LRFGQKQCGYVTLKLILNCKHKFNAISNIKPDRMGVSDARVEEVGLLFVVSDGREEEFTAGFAVVVETAAGRGGIVIGGRGGMVMRGSAVSAG
jgi:hypothetical protein